MNYFYAYHSQEQDQDFDVNGGYGLPEKSKSKYEKVNQGDQVFIIQRLKGNDYYELCGLYEIESHYESPNVKRKYRYKLKEVLALRPFKKLDAKALSQLLPKKSGLPNFNNFQKHFSVNGVSFQAPLTDKVKRFFFDLLDTKEQSKVESDSYKRLTKDTRKKILKEIAQRQGQAKFRDALLGRYSNKCQISGCDVQSVLEAAHICSYRGENDNHVDNGLLLRADLHTLFDLDYLGICPDTMVVSFHSAACPAYAQYEGVKLNVTQGSMPSIEALKIRYAEFLKRRSAIEK